MPILLYTTQDKKVKVAFYELGESVFLAQDSMAKQTKNYKYELQLESIIKSL